MTSMKIPTVSSSEFPSPLSSSSPFLFPSPSLLSLSSSAFLAVDSELALQPAQEDSSTPTFSKSTPKKTSPLQPSAAFQIVKTYLLLEEANQLSAKFLQELLSIKNEDFQLFLKEQLQATQSSQKAAQTESFLSTLQKIIATLTSISSIVLGTGCIASGATSIGISLVGSGTAMLTNELIDLLHGWQFFASLLYDDIASQETFALIAKSLVFCLSSLTSIAAVKYGALLLQPPLADILKNFSATTSSVTQAVTTVGNGYGKYKTSTSNQLCEENKKNLQDLRYENQQTNLSIQALAKEQSLATGFVSEILSTLSTPV